MKRVTTPHGKRTIAFTGAVGIAAAIDVAIAAILGTIALDAAGLRSGYGSIPQGVVILVVCSYAWMAHRAVVPSVGGWCVGLERCRFEEVAEYEGKGTLYVLSDRPVAWRVAGIVGAFVGIYILASAAKAF